MQPLGIAIGIIEQAGNYVLQLRDGDPRIGAAGKVGCFGGKIEGSETPEFTVAREVAEETSLQTSPSDWKQLGIVHVESDRLNQTINVEAHVFYIKVDSKEVITATEGQLIRLDKTVAADDKRLTPATKAAFDELL